MQKSLAASTLNGAALHTRHAHLGNAVVVPFRKAIRPSLGVCRRLEVVRAQVVEVAQETLRLPRWDYIFDQLNENNVKSIKAKEAEQLIKKGYVLVDVRPPHIFEKAHPEGSVNVPLFQRVNFRNFSVTGYLRAAALALNGVDPVEPNPKFSEMLLQQVGEGGKLIVACEAGGSLVPNPSFVTGKESRSLKAAYKAVVAKKYSDIKHLNGGVYGWWKADLPFEGEYDLENVGRTPNVVSGED
ncbi:g1516 [Coccomyxa viridis]|uniref:G1516 protein n=1 Tax=Coccomyxa viridis TaxID=1274662 RepID=A0ABP1FI60_9CHLO